MRKPRYCIVQCAWCNAEHWLVKRNILTSRAIPAVAAYADKALAQTDCDERNAKPRRRRG